MLIIVYFTCVQRMLLQDLHDRHVCNSLLVAESEEDIWKTETVYRKRLNTSDGESDGCVDASTHIYIFIHFHTFHGFLHSFLIKCAKMRSDHHLSDLN